MPLAVHTPEVIGAGLSKVYHQVALLATCPGEAWLGWIIVKPVSTELVRNLKIMIARGVRLVHGLLESGECC
jgi:hypothetical protein